MSLEARVDILEQKHELLDESVHSLVRAVADVKDIALKNQQDIAAVKDIALKNQRDIKALCEASFAGFRRVDERFDEHDKRFDQLEMLIRQLIPNAQH